MRKTRLTLGGSLRPLRVKANRWNPLMHLKHQSTLTTSTEARILGEDFSIIDIKRTA